MVKGLFCWLLLAGSVVSAKELDKADLIEKVKTALAQESEAFEDIKIVFDNPELKLPASLANLEPEVESIVFSTDHKRFTINGFSHPAPLKGGKWFIKGRIQTLVNVPVLVRSLSLQEPIKESDIIWIKIPSQQLMGTTILTSEHLVGKIAAQRSLSPNKPLNQFEVKALNIIKKGDSVEVIYRTPYLMVTSRAEAQQDAAKGQPVRLTAPETKKTIYAVAVDVNQAEITPIGFSHAPS